MSGDTNRIIYPAVGIGFILGFEFAIACFGWALHWNAYINLLWSLGFVVLCLTARAAVRPDTHT